MRYVDVCPFVERDEQPIMSWPERIRQAREFDSFSSDDIELAGQWPTCACGHQDAGIPRDTNGEPIDGELRTLGHRFCWAVDNNCFDQAEDYLAQIQARAIEILKEQTK